MPIFISYSHADSDFVDRLATQLVSHAVSVWVDRWEISVGDSLIDRVEDAIGGASALLVVLSTASVASNWVKKEVNAGLVRELEEKQVVVLPVLIEDCKVPMFLREKFFADFRTSFDHGLQRILESVARVTNPNSARTDDPTFHTDWGLDWGRTDGRLFLRLRFVEQAIDQPYTVLSAVHLLADHATTAAYEGEVESFGEDSVHRGIVQRLATEVGDMVFVLGDQFEQLRQFELDDGATRFAVSVTAQRLGEDTGRDVLYRAGHQIDQAARRMSEVAAGPRTGTDGQASSAARGGMRARHAAGADGSVVISTKSGEEDPR